VPVEPGAYTQYLLSIAAGWPMVKKEAQKKEKIRGKPHCKWASN